MTSRGTHHSVTSGTSTTPAGECVQCQSADAVQFTFEAAAEHNNQIPDAQGILASLREKFGTIPEGDLFTPEICEWIHELQVERGVEAENPGQLNHRTLLWLEDEVRERRSDVRTGERDRSYYIALQADLLWPSSTDPEEMYHHYAAVVRTAGHRVNPPDEDNPDGRPRPTVLGIRGLTVGDLDEGVHPLPERAQATHEVRSRSTGYSDTFVILQAPTTQPPYAVEFFGSTYPAQDSTEQAADVNDDGFDDVGMLRPGDYDVHAGDPMSGGRAAYHIRRRRVVNEAGELVDPVTGTPIEDEEELEKVPGWRDLTENDEGEGDTRIRAAERQRSEEHRVDSESMQTDEAMGEYLTVVYFHQGGAYGPASIACQNLPPEEYDRFMEALGEDLEDVYDDNRTSVDFSYALIDAREFILDHPDFRSPEDLAAAESSAP